MFQGQKNCANPSKINNLFLMPILVKKIVTSRAYFSMFTFSGLFILPLKELQSNKSTRYTSQVVLTALSAGNVSETCLSNPSQVWNNLKLYSNYLLQQYICRQIFATFYFVESYLYSTKIYIWNTYSVLKLFTGN